MGKVSGKLRKHCTKIFTFYLPREKLPTNCTCSNEIFNSDKCFPGLLI